MAELEEILRSGLVTNDGPRLHAFERAVSRWLGVEGCVGVSSGSAALVCGLTALAPKPGTALLPSFTYISTVNAVEHAGLRPVFVDIDPDTWTMDSGHVQACFERYDDIQLVVPVTCYGVPPDLDTICQVARANGAAVLLDNAHGFGTVDHGRRVHVGPDVQAWSCHATKVLPAVEGGLVTARDPQMLAEVRRLRRHGLADDRGRSTPGYNARLDELRAAIGRHALESVEGVLQRRRLYSSRLRKHLGDRCGGLWQLQAVPDGIEPNGQNLAVVWRGPCSVEELRQQLEEEGVGSVRYFYPALHRVQRWRTSPSLPVTEDVVERVICLPLHSEMSDAVLSRIEEATERVSARYVG